MTPSSRLPLEVWGRRLMTRAEAWADRSRLRRYAYEFLWFGLKQGWACGDAGPEAGELGGGAGHLPVPCRRDDHGAVQDLSRVVDLSGRVGAEDRRRAAVLGLHVCGGGQLHRAGAAHLPYPGAELSAAVDDVGAGGGDLRQLLCAPLAAGRAAGSVRGDGAAVHAGVVLLHRRPDAAVDAAAVGLWAGGAVHLVRGEPGDVRAGLGLSGAGGRMAYGQPEQAGGVVPVDDHLGGAGVDRAPAGGGGALMRPSPTRGEGRVTVWPSPCAPDWGGGAPAGARTGSRPGSRAQAAGPVDATARRRRRRCARGAASGVAAERRRPGARGFRRGAELPDRAQAGRCGAGGHDGARGGPVGLRRRSGHCRRRRGGSEGGAGARSGDPVAVAALHVFQGVSGAAGLARGALAVDPGPRHPGLPFPEPDFGAVPAGHPPGGADRLGRLSGPWHGHRHRRDGGDRGRGVHAARRDPGRDRGRARRPSSEDRSRRAAGRRGQGAGQHHGRRLRQGGVRFGGVEAGAGGLHRGGGACKAGQLPD
uniref:PE-PGRS family protein n=1 Tax=Parastrongyloides trichosuri TaxID=131310 RepID=A0A0N4ZWK4_PARTI